MGQKVHPIGARLGITQSSRSNWYAKDSDYAFFVYEDQLIRTHVLTSRKHCIISKIEISRRGLDIRIRIFAVQVGLIIGEDGTGLVLLRRELEHLCKTIRLRYDHSQNGNRTQQEWNKREDVAIQIFVRQVSNPESNASCLANFFVTQLEKRTPFRRIFRIVAERAQNLGKVRGFRFQVSGRLNGAEIARTEWVRGGRVPLQTFSAELDYFSRSASTIYGLVGVQVLIFKP